MTKGRNYPDSRFWELAAEEGCDCILGWDAHRPVAMQDTDTLNAALAGIRSLELRLLDTVPMRRI